MCNSETRAQVMKPLLIKAGIPAALSIAAYIFSKMKSTTPPSPSVESSSLHPDQETGDPLRDTESFHSLDSVSHQVEGECEDVSQACNLQSKLLLLESQIQELEQREYDLESQYIRYRAMKEREIVLIEIKNKMLVEKTKAEFLLKEISLANEENNKIASLLIQCIKLAYKVENLNIENGLLEKKVKKLSKRGKDRLTIMEEQKLAIEAKDEELLKIRKDFEKSENVVEDLEGELKQLKEVVDHLQREKIELTIKLDNLADEVVCSNNTKVEVLYSVTTEEYEKVVNELDQIRKDKEDEAKEVEYLRRSNAFLRHELARIHDQREQNNEDNHEEHHQLVEFLAEEHDNENENCTMIVNSQVPSKRRRFIQKFKNWVNTDEKGKVDNKCFGKHSEEAGDLFVHARKSCSSI